MRQTLLSIIIPVYNTEKFVENCLNSLLEQDVEKSSYEIICINDGSTDDSLSILKKYGNAYENVRIIDQTNSGVAISRNRGLIEARGEYVWFVDADDWVARNSFGLIYSQIIKYLPSVVQIGYDWIKAEWRIEECSKIVLNKDKVKCSVHGVSVLQYDGAWSSIVKKEMLVRYNHHFVEGLHYGEDILFMREIFDRMRIETENGEYDHRIVHCQDEVFYYYRLHEESACRTSWTANREKYMEALLNLARINREKALDKTKPSWYIEKYNELFFERMYNYMIYWLPGARFSGGGDGDIKQHLRMLKEEALYPCSKPPKKMYLNWIKADNYIGKMKNIYKYFAFRMNWLYSIYYKQMRRKMQNSGELDGK